MCVCVSVCVCLSFPAGCDEAVRQQGLHFEHFEENQIKTGSIEESGRESARGRNMSVLCCCPLRRQRRATFEPACEDGFPSAKAAAALLLHSHRILLHLPPCSPGLLNPYPTHSAHSSSTTRPETLSDAQQAEQRRAEARQALVAAVAAVRADCDKARAESASDPEQKTAALQRLQALRKLLRSEQEKLSVALEPLATAAEALRQSVDTPEPALDALVAAGAGPAFALRDVHHEARVQGMDRAATAAIRGCPDPFLQGQLADELQVGGGKAAP